MERFLTGKTALVTGSTSGLGKEIVENLAALGARVAIHGFGEASEIQRFQEGLQKTHGVEVFYHPADLTVPAQIDALIGEVRGRLGSIDILVNNAGAQFVSPLEQFPDEQWDRLIALNLSASFHATKLVLPEMKARHWGRIINIASAHGLVASPFKSAYVAAKHGLIGLTKVTALEVAKEGITCNALCPGFIHTPIVEGQIESQAKATGVPREQIIEEIILAKHATKEFVLSSQVAAYVNLLCSEAGASTTGAAISIDGGWTSS